MNKLANHDIYWIGQRLPKEVTEVIKNNNLFVAGGFIRSCILNEPVSDIDIFASSKETASMAADLLSTCFEVKSKKKLRRIETDNAITMLGLAYPVQFIHKWVFSNVETALKSFDFTIAMAGVWMGKRSAGSRRSGTHDQLMGICHENYYQDLAAKRLIYTSPQRIEEAGGSLLRVLKFYQRGYRIPLKDMAAVVARLAHEVDTTSEEAMTTVFTKLLREVDPEIDPEHRAHLPNLDDL